MRKIIPMVLAMVLCLTSFGLTVSAESAKNVEVGSSILLGHYEQDNDTTNGAEPIEWLVLEVEGNKALLISRYGLDAKPYNQDYIDVTWETCSLRAWMNDDFFTAAFTDEEQNAILTTTVDNSDSQGYDFTKEYDYAEKVTGGNDTEDKVFLLSYAEVSKYYEVTFRNDKNKSARVAPTAYAQENGAARNTQMKTKNDGLATWWWLRSPGTVQSYAARVGADGALSLDCVHMGKTAVRPAMWVDLDASIF